MAVKVTFEWDCDLCLRPVVSEKSDMPHGWMEMVFNIDAGADSDKPAVRHICFMCVDRIAEFRERQLTETRLKTQEVLTPSHNPHAVRRRCEECEGRKTVAHMEKLRA